MINFSYKLIILTAFLLISEAHSHNMGKADMGKADMDSADQEALKQTQELLKNKTQRDQAIKDSPAAQQAADFVQQLTGGDQQMSEDIFALAAEVFSIVVQESKGDVNKMNLLLENFKKNPAQFAEKWSPEQKSRLKSLADKLEKPALQPK